MTKAEIEKRIGELEEEFRQVEEHILEDQCEDVNCAEALLAILQEINPLRQQLAELTEGESK